MACFFGTDHLRAALGKGSHVTVSGRLRQTRWESGGRKMYGVEVIASALDISSIRAAAAEGGVALELA